MPSRKINQSKSESQADSLPNLPPTTSSQTSIVSSRVNSFKGTDKMGEKEKQNLILIKNFYFPDFVLNDFTLCHLRHMYYCETGILHCPTLQMEKLKQKDVV